LVIVLAFASHALANDPFEVEIWDEENGQRLVFITAGNSGQERLESCGVFYDVQWIQQEDGRWKTSFDVVGNCDSATVVGNKIFTDHADHWNVIDGWVRRIDSVDEPPVAIRPSVEVFSEDQGNLVILLGENLTGNEEIEYCGQHHPLDWQAQDDDRLRAQFSIVECPAFTLYWTNQIWVDSSLDWNDGGDGWMVRVQDVEDPVKDLRLELWIPFLVR